MMQHIIVALIVTGAVWAVIWRYAPAAVRKSLLGLLSRAFKALGWESAATRAGKSAAAGGCTDGCGSCGGCDSKEASPSKKQVAMTPEALRRTARR
jgi:hypothetical protein